MENQEIIKSIKQGKILIYPTDTIYGLGCDAENRASVQRIKEIKARDKDKPLSIIEISPRRIYYHTKKEKSRIFKMGFFILHARSKNSHK
jgi:L-threonylcarbamoyladenylate synthase